MKVTIGQLRASREALLELAQSRVPASVAIRIALVLRAAQPVLQESDNQFNQLLVKYGTPHDDNPAQFDIKVDSIPAFREEEAAMNVETVDVPLPELIRADRLGSAEMKPASLAVLDWLITAE